MEERRLFNQLKVAHVQISPLLSTLPLTLSDSKESRNKLKRFLEALRIKAQDYTRDVKKGPRGVGREVIMAEAEWLDVQGVGLWNAAVMSTRATVDATGDEVEDPLLAAMLRLVAMRMVQAGEVAVSKETRAAWDTRLLIFASDTALFLRRAGVINVAVTVLGEAVEYETQVKQINDDKGEAVAALLRYYIAQIDIVMVDKNGLMAKLHLNKAMSLVETSNIAYFDLLALTEQCRSAGQILPQAEGSSEDSVAWFEAGLKLLGEMEERYPITISQGQEALKITILRNLAHAYLSNKDPSNSTKANEILSQLIAITGPDSSLATSTTQDDLRQIKILQLRCMAGTELQESIKEALGELIGSTAWTEEGVNEILALINGLKQYTGRYDAYKQVLDAALSTPDGHPHVVAILHNTVRRTAGKAEVIFAEVGKALDAIASCATYDPSASGIDGFLACATLIMNVGDNLEKQEKWKETASIYRLASHPVLSPPDSDNYSMCRRKAAIAYISANDHIAAQDMLDGCNHSEATTHYLLFLVAIHQKRETGAINAIKAILQCPDVTPELVRLSASLAVQKSGDKVLQCAIRAMLEMLSRTGDETLRGNVMAVSRYLIQADLRGMKETQEGSEEYAEAGRNLAADCGNVVELLQSDPGLIGEDFKTSGWLWKTILQAAMDNTDKLDNATLADLFNHASVVMLLCTADDSATEVDPLMPGRIATAMYACLCCKLFLAREMSDLHQKNEAFKLIYDYIPTCQARAVAAEKSENEKVAGMVKGMRISLEAARMEALAQMEMWDELEKTLQALAGHADDVRMMEAMMDALIALPSTPVIIITGLIESILSLLSTDPAGIANHARYTHLSISILDSQPDLVQQQYETLAKARDVVQARGEAYPQDEIQWLYTFCWNKGLNLLGASEYEHGAMFTDLAKEFGVLCRMRDRQRASEQKQQRAMLSR